MTLCFIFNCCIPDSFSLLICGIRLLVFRFNRFCNTSTTFRAYIVICFVFNTICLCIVYFMEFDVMMFMSCIFLFYTWTIFNQTTIRTTFLCKCIATTGCRYRNCFIVMRSTCQCLHINCINEVSWPHELVIIIALTAHELLILLVVCISRIVICLFELITITTGTCMIKQASLTWNEREVCTDWNNQFVTLHSQTCDWMICNSKVCTVFACCCKRHTAKQLCIITFCRYCIVFLHNGYCTVCRIVGYDIVGYVEVNLTICVQRCCQTDRWVDALFIYELCIQFCQKVVLHHLAVFENAYKCIVIIVVFLVCEVNQCLIVTVAITCILFCQFMTNNLVLCSLLALIHAWTVYSVKQVCRIIHVVRITVCIVNIACRTRHPCCLIGLISCFVFIERSQRTEITII